MTAAQFFKENNGAVYSQFFNIVGFQEILMVMHNYASQQTKELQDRIEQLEKELIKTHVSNMESYKDLHEGNNRMKEFIYSAIEQSIISDEDWIEEGNQILKSK